MRKRALLLGLCLLLALSGCVTKPSEQTSVPTPSVTPAATATPTPSSKPSATATPAPTASEEATASAKPTPTASAKPTAKATETAEPTAEPSGDPAAETCAAGLTAEADYDFSAPVPETEAVDESYFDDAAFIGDSRTDGFRLYSGIKNGTFIVHTGLSVFQVDSKNITFKGKKMKVLDALGKGTYGKVYICLGVNELGMKNDEGYRDHFAKLVDDIRAQQPDATIYLQLLIPVNEKKCREKGIASYIENGHLQTYNDILREVAQEKHVFFVDPAEDIVDETGEPPYDTVSDGVHFKRAPYKLWFDYLKRHTVEKGSWDA